MRLPYDPKKLIATGPYIFFQVDIEIQFAPEKQIYKYITFIVKKSNDIVSYGIKLDQGNNSTSHTALQL